MVKAAKTMVNADMGNMDKSLTVPTPYDETPGEAPVFPTACGWTLQGALQSRFW